MKRQLGVMTPLLFLCMSALLWVSCSNTRTLDSIPIFEAPPNTCGQAVPMGQGWAQVESNYPTQANPNYPPKVNSDDPPQDNPSNPSQPSSTTAPQANPTTPSQASSTTPSEAKPATPPQTKPTTPPQAKPTTPPQANPANPPQVKSTTAPQVKPSYPQVSPNFAQEYSETPSEEGSAFTQGEGYADFTQGEGESGLEQCEDNPNFMQSEGESDLAPDEGNPDLTQGDYEPTPPPLRPVSAAGRPPYCEAPCEGGFCQAPPVCPQGPPCGPAGTCRYPTSNELECGDCVVVTARSPSMCLLGEEYALDFDVKACDDVCDVVVTTYLPEDVSLICSQPDAQIEGRKVTWYFGSMRRGECRPAKVLLKCQCEGEQCASFCATAVPVRYCSVLCAKPVLTCNMCGPNEVCPGDCVNYTIMVSNRGSCTAEDVVITDNVPDGLQHSSCLRTLTYKLGCLDPCQTKRVNISFTAVKRGKICNTAVVSACNADSTSCQWCTNVCRECVEITKEGPAEQQIGKPADYHITVTNAGDMPLTGLIVTDNAPCPTTIVAANGARVIGNQAVWKINELRPGDKANFTITLTTCVPGCFVNCVSVTDHQGCDAQTEFHTLWRGRPALNVCVNDTQNPICVGHQTSYCITVVNQGPEADNNVVVSARFPKELVPVSAGGNTNSTIYGQTVTFEPYENFGPRQALRYRIDARGRVPGDARVLVEVTSDSVKTPIMQQASTIVN